MEYEIDTISKLEVFVTEKWNYINAFLDAEFDGLPVPLYNSVDIRENGYKIVPVDNNIYPAGFNNICMLDLDSASANIDNFILKINPEAEIIGILTESNTKNTFYLDHLSYLRKAITDAGFSEVHFITLDEKLFEDGKSTLELVSASNFDVVLNKAQVKNGEFYINDKKLDFVVMNHDQSSKLTVEWDKVTTPVHPSPKIGWYNRSKSDHFIKYCEALHKFCEKFSIDPSLLQADFRLVKDIDFSQKTGLEELAKVVDQVKGAHDGKKVFIKGDQGTYGMGISVVSSGQDVLDFNRKDRKKMNVGKNNLKFTSVIVQEGIDTILKYDDMPAEVTIYLVGGKSVGGFMRANSEKGAQENLNSRGMVFKKFCISEIRQNQDHKAKEALYSIIARLSSLASAYEIKERG
jgi:glutamate--cysteine ligase